MYYKHPKKVLLGYISNKLHIHNLLFMFIFLNSVVVQPLQYFIRIYNEPTSVILCLIPFNNHINQPHKFNICFSCYRNTFTYWPVFRQKKKKTQIMITVKKPSPHFVHKSQSHIHCIISQIIDATLCKLSTTDHRQWW